ncbi:hypothetical protein DK68_3153 [Brucella suis]|nr:hypothetical protein DK68_3153 [Brucella suis]KFJ62857.1 hypothetical protein DK59_2983 [Brucella abortus bv. 4 str. 292]
MPGFVIGNFHPAVEEAAWNGLYGKSGHDIERKINGVQFNMGKCMHQRDAAMFCVERTLLQHAWRHEFRLFGASGAFGQGRIEGAANRKCAGEPAACRFPRQANLFVQIAGGYGANSVAAQCLFIGRLVGHRVQSVWGSESAGGFKNGLGVSIDFDLVPDLSDASIGANQKGRALHAHIFASIHAFFHPHAIGFKRHAIFIGHQIHRQRMFGAEPGMFRCAIG